MGCTQGLAGKYKRGRVWSFRDVDNNDPNAWTDFFLGWKNKFDKGIHFGGQSWSSFYEKTSYAAIVAEPHVNTYQPVSITYDVPDDPSRTAQWKLGWSEKTYGLNRENQLMYKDDFNWKTLRLYPSKGEHAVRVNNQNHRESILSWIEAHPDLCCKFEDHKDFNTIKRKASDWVKNNKED